MSKVVIRWPNGKEEELKDVAADAIYTVVEGSGVKDKVALSGWRRKFDAYGAEVLSANVEPADEDPAGARANSS